MRLRNRPSSISDNIVLPITSRKAVWLAHPMALSKSATSRAAFLGSITFQKRTASTSTGTISLVSVFSALNVVVMTRISIQYAIESITGIIKNNQCSFFVLFLYFHRSCPLRIWLDCYSRLIGSPSTKSIISFEVLGNSGPRYDLAGPTCMGPR